MKIYKFRSSNKPEDIEEILRDNLFYFADWRKLNDPMEGYFHYYEADHSPEELRKVVEGKDAYGVCSLSMVNDDILLWTHYASNHTGVCIEIDADIDHSNEVALEPVKYRPNIPWLRKDTGNLRDAKDILTTKISKWKFEQEIRAFCEGKGRKLAIGRITKVILGIRVDPDIKQIVNQYIEPDRIAQARLNFETNTIDA